MEKEGFGVIPGGHTDRHGGRSRRSGPPAGYQRDDNLSGGVDSPLSGRAHLEGGILSRERDRGAAVLSGTSDQSGHVHQRPLGHADPVFRGCGLREKTQPDCLVRRELRVGAERLGGGPVPDLEVHHAEERDGRGTVDLHGYPDIQGEAAALLRRH